MEWFSIEVIDGSTSARLWADTHGDALIYAAQLEGAVDWEWHEHRWGVVLEVAFPDELTWDRYRESLAVQHALDAVPDPLFGLIIHRGRGGSAGTRNPRKPRPLAGAGAVAIPIPVGFDIEAEFDDLSRRPVALLA